MTEERWRLFVAIPIGDELRATLTAAVREWRNDPRLGGLRWTDPANWHVTLAFLGVVEARAVADLTARLGAALGGHDVMQLHLGRLGGFPSTGQARVVWDGIATEGDRLNQLALDVRAALGVAAGETFLGHVTLARAARSPVDLRSWIAEADSPDGRSDVGEVDVMRSHRVGAGPRYEKLASIPLARRPSS